MRERAEREYWPVAVAVKAAELIAGQPQGEKPLTTAQAERLAELMLPSEALEDASGEIFGGANRWAMIAGVALAAEEASRAHRHNTSGS
jgi:hypothetical protein